MPETRADELAYVVGSIHVSVGDFARAMAVQAGRGEDANSPAMIQDAIDILDRAFRYAQDRSATQS